MARGPPTEQRVSEQTGGGRSRQAVKGGQDEEPTERDKRRSRAWGPAVSRFQRESLGGPCGTACWQCWLIPGSSILVSLMMSDGGARRERLLKGNSIVSSVLLSLTHLTVLDKDHVLNLAKSQVLFVNICHVRDRMDTERENAREEERMRTWEN